MVGRDGSEDGGGCGCTCVQILIKRDAHSRCWPVSMWSVSADAAAPVMIAVVADQVGDRRSGYGGCEDVGVGR